MALTERCAPCLHATVLPSSQAFYALIVETLDAEQDAHICLGSIFFQYVTVALLFNGGKSLETDNHNWPVAGRGNRLCWPIELSVWATPWPGQHQ